MNRFVTTAAAAAAAASALLSAAGVREARAQLVYDPFNYPAAAPLEGKVNPTDAQPWATMSANAGDDDMLGAAGSLTYTGLAAPTGNSVSFGGTGKSERLGFDRTARAGTMFYSMVLRVADLGAMTTTPTFIAGFSDRAGPSALAPTTVGTRLYLKQSAAGAQTFRLGVSKNNGFDILFDEATNYDLNTPILVVGSYEIVGSGSGTNDVAKLYVNPTSLGTAAAPTTSTPTSPIITAPVTGTDLTISGVPSLAGFVLRQGSSAATTVPNVQIDELRVDNAWARVTPPTGVSWSATNGGAWSESAKWSTLAVPNAPDAFVNLNGNGSGPRTITVDQAVALRAITISSSQPYTLGAGGGGSGLNFSASSGINVRAGSHTIAAPVTLGGEMLASVATGSSLNLTGDLSLGANTLIKAGDGVMTVKNLRGPAVEVVAGTLAVAPNGGVDGTSRVTSLSIGPDGSLDVRDNKFITDTPAGSFNGTAYAGVQGEVARAYNFGAWDQPGLKTSEPNAGQNAGPLSGTTTIGVATAEQVLFIAPTETTVVFGQTVTGASTIAMYTYAGDVNLDGLIDGADYGTLDNWIQFPGTSGYANGDVNYDGVIDGADYGVLDNSIQLQGAPFLGVNESFAGGASALTSISGVTAVPEPSALIAVASTTIAGVLSRRRR